MSKLNSLYGSKSVDPNYNAKNFKKFLETLLIRRGYDKEYFSLLFNIDYRYFRSQFHLRTKVSMKLLRIIILGLNLTHESHVKLTNLARYKNEEINQLKNRQE